MVCAAPKPQHIVAGERFHWSREERRFQRERFSRAWFMPVSHRTHKQSRGSAEAARMQSGSSVRPLCFHSPRQHEHEGDFFKKIKIKIVFKKKIVQTEKVSRTSATSGKNESRALNNCPLNLKTGCATLCSNNCNQAFAITGCGHCCGGILAHSSLQNCFNSATLEGFQAWNDCLWSRHSISIGFKSRLWLGQNLNFVFLEPFRGGLAGEFGIIVLLHNPSALELEVTNWWLDILLQDFLIECRIHDSINYGKSSRSWCCKAAPDHHTTITFDCWYDVLMRGSRGLMVRESQTRNPKVASSSLYTGRDCRWGEWMYSLPPSIPQLRCPWARHRTPNCSPGAAA